VIDEAFCQLEPLLGTKVACAAVGRSRATHYRHLKPGRTTEAKPRPAPPNKLADTEVDDILGVLRSPRFVDCSPAQVYFTLLDEGVYLASESSFYRILRSHDEVRERRRQATHPAKVRPELIADKPLVVWSWDITKLKGPKRGVYYDLYVVIDLCRPRDYADPCAV
jgi:putative transposase